MLRAAIAGARASGLTDRQIGAIVDDELSGDHVCRLEEYISRHAACVGEG